MPSREPLDTMMETFSILSVMVVILSGSDAAAGLGDSGDAGGQFGRALGEQLVELLDRDAGGLAECAHGGAGALVGVFGADELQHLPVPVGQLADPRIAGDLRRHF